jgi:TonB family protein
MHSRFVSRLGLTLLLCATTALGVDESQRDFGLSDVLSDALPVYPFEALLQGRTGKANLECLFNRQGQLVGAKVTNSTDLDFVGAALAWADIFNSKHVLRAAKNANPGEGLLQYSQTIDFREKAGREVLLPLAAPTDSAMRIIAKLRKDPAWKGYSTGKMLDHPLEVVSQLAPVFPLQLVGKAESGTAMIEFFVDEDGSAVLPRVVSASDPAFGFAACQSIATWKFKPPLKRGIPTVLKVRVPVMFSLAGKAQ